jgi:hypothetical protein
MGATGIYFLASDSSLIWSKVDLPFFIRLLVGSLMVTEEIQ